MTRANEIRLRKVQPKPTKHPLEPRRRLDKGVSHLNRGGCHPEECTTPGILRNDVQHTFPALIAKGRLSSLAGMHTIAAWQLELDFAYCTPLSL